MNSGTLYRTGPGGYQTTTAKNTTFEASHVGWPVYTMDFNIANLEPAVV